MSNSSGKVPQAAHGNSNYRRKVKVLVLLVVVCLLALFVEGGLTDRLKSDLELLAVEDTWVIDFKEVSGLASVSPSFDNKIDLIAVSDRRSQIEEVLIERGGRSINKTIPVELRSVDLDGKKSNYEAVAIDASDHVFVLSERDCNISVVDTRALTVVNRIVLDCESWYRANGAKKRKSNAGPEGLILLKNGHVLVAMQGSDRIKPALVEFGPQNSSSVGTVGLLKADWPFAFEKPNNRLLLFVPLATWRLEQSVSNCQMNDLARGPGKQLYALSKNCRQIFRLSSEIVHSMASVPITGRWSLPNAVPDPEGLLVDKKQSFLVASDRKSVAPNLFLLTPP